MAGACASAPAPKAGPERMRRGLESAVAIRTDSTHRLDVTIGRQRANIVVSIKEDRKMGNGFLDRQNDLL
ncbi:hypothetical protein AA13594_3096 [Gluconacetobacter azotocaptans DSM 13594]|nr:hypothetical protein AA13594_3096 [Gluconacetobacter azotocaptans DSM 13594]